MILQRLRVLEWMATPYHVTLLSQFNCGLSVFLMEANPQDYLIICCFNEYIASVSVLNLMICSKTNQITILVTFSSTPFYNSVQVGSNYSLFIMHFEGVASWNCPNN